MARVATSAARALRVASWISVSSDLGPVEVTAAGRSGRRGPCRRRVRCAGRRSGRRRSAPRRSSPLKSSSGRVADQSRAPRSSGAWPSWGARLRAGGAGDLPGGGPGPRSTVRLIGCGGEREESCIGKVLVWSGGASPSARDRLAPTGGAPHKGFERSVPCGGRRMVARSLEPEGRPSRTADIPAFSRDRPPAGAAAVRRAALRRRRDPDGSG